MSARSPRRRRPATDLAATLPPPLSQPDPPPLPSSLAECTMQFRSRCPRCRKVQRHQRCFDHMEYVVLAHAIASRLHRQSQRERLRLQTTCPRCGQGYLINKIHCDGR